MRDRKLVFFIVSILIFSILIGGCASKSLESRDSAPMENSSPPSDMDYSYQEDMSVEKEKGYDSQLEPEKIITTINITMETKEFTETTDKLTRLISEYKGYIEDSNISHNNYINSARLKSAEYTIRIPKGNSNGFVNELKNIGNIISENTNKQDITKQYRDSESRLKVLETKEARLLVLMEKAERMEDIIVLENSLSEVIYEKEILTGNIQAMDDKVDYSTIYFHLNEVAKLSLGENVKTPFMTKLKNAFKDSMYFFAYNIENLAIGLIYFLPYGIIMGIVLFLLIRFLKRIKLNKPKE